LVTKADTLKLNVDDTGPASSVQHVDNPANCDILLQLAELSLAPRMGRRRRRFDAMDSFVTPRAKLVKQSLCSCLFLWNAIKTCSLVLFFYFFSISLTFYNQKYFHVRVLPPRCACTNRHMMTSIYISFNFTIHKPVDKIEKGLSH